MVGLWRQTSGPESRNQILLENLTNLGASRTRQCLAGRGVLLAIVSTVSSERAQS